MANRTFYPSQSYGNGHVYCEFELAGAGASALTFVTGADAVASISRSGTGIFVVTMKDAYNKCLFKCADIDDTLNDGAYCTVSDCTNEGTASPFKFTIRVRAAAGTAADPAAARRIGVSLVFRNTLAVGNS